MAQGLLARYSAGILTEFVQRVSQALIEEAVAVYSEAGQPGTARAALAISVVLTPPDANGVSPRAAAVARLLTQQGLDDTSTDAQIIAGVANVWNALAGA